MVHGKSSFFKIIEELQNKGILTIGDFLNAVRLGKDLTLEKSKAKGATMADFKRAVDHFVKKSSGIVDLATLKGESRPKEIALPLIGKGFMRFVPQRKKAELDSMIPHGELTVLRKSFHSHLRFKNNLQNTQLVSTPTF